MYSIKLPTNDLHITFGHAQGSCPHSAQKLLTKSQCCIEILAVINKLASRLHSSDIKFPVFTGLLGILLIGPSLLKYSVSYATRFNLKHFTGGC